MSEPASGPTPERERQIRHGATMIAAEALALVREIGAETTVAVLLSTAVVTAQQGGVAADRFACMVASLLENNIALGDDGP